MKFSPPKYAVTEKVFLLGLLSDYGSMVNDDSLSFLSVRLDDSARKILKGHGNFLGAMGSLSTLNLYAKVNKILTGDYDDSLLEQALKDFEKAKTTFPSLTQFEIQPLNKKGKIIEAYAFRKLVDMIYPDIDLGVSPDEAAEVWNNFRNTPTHLAMILKAGAFGVFDYHKDWTFEKVWDCVRQENGASTDDLKILAKASGVLTQAFQRNDNGNWECNSDVLAIQVTKVKEWLLGRVESSTEERCREVNAYLKRWQDIT